MGVVTIKQVTFADLENDPDFTVLCDENSQESHIDGMPPNRVHHETYRIMERNGAILFLGAYESDRLIGFLSVLATILPHYSVKVAMSESFFVRKADRKTGAGLKLLEAGERIARALGSPGFFLSAPTGSILSKVLPKRGYDETNRVYFKRFK